MKYPILPLYRMTGTQEIMVDYHSHQEYEIYFFHSGSCRYLIKNQIYDLEPGDILLMDGKSLHKPIVSLDKEYIRSVVHFSPQWIESVLKELKALYLLDVFRKLHHCFIRTNENQQSKQLEKLICRLDELFRTSDDNESFMAETEMKILLIQILLLVNKMGRANSYRKPDKKDEKTDYVENIVTFIQENYMDKLTVDSIAQSLNLSKSYLSHLFKEMTGFTVMEYLMATRLTQAKIKLVMEPDKPLKDVAFDCGFESASHFSRYFKQKVGENPKDYRKKHVTETEK
ncbi:AraC family transcriptional regulator [Bacillus timonensis]|uniref:AraC family transcriptional regulator n=1 Tax=Bacillus timonensis TaxID=1033734 RepID=UPI0005A76224|nr:AraC family transcriptional regulator [Bacillus timonensis]